jgi:predicted O-methyltransferase YrrM
MQPLNVLEFGSGFSSLVIAQELENQGSGKLISLDNSVYWSNKLKNYMPSRIEERITLYVFRLTARIYYKKPLIFYDIPKKFYRNYPQFDFVLVDAPHQDVGREAAMYESFKRVRKGGIFFVDDSNSGHMQTTVEKWKRAFGDLISISNFRGVGNGISIILKNDELTHKISFTSKELIFDWARCLRNFFRISKLDLNQ